MMDPPEHEVTSKKRPEPHSTVPITRSSAATYRSTSVVVRQLIDKLFRRWSLSRRWFVRALTILLLPLMYNFLRHGNDVFSSKDDYPPLRHQPSVRFIPYPHKTLGSGIDFQCQWETRAVAQDSNSSEETSSLDFAQRNAYTQGICIPPSLKDILHIFSTAEAVECLSSEVQHRDIKLLISGDSYMKQLYIGLVDILLSKPINNDTEMLGSTQRNQLVNIAQSEMEKYVREKNESIFPHVKYTGEQCYGYQPLKTTCSTIFNSTNAIDNVYIIGSAVHIYRRHRQNQVNATVQEIINFLDTTERTIYVSPPYYYPHKAFTDQFIRDQADVYNALLPNMAPENPAHPFLDVYELTRSCTWENCSYDRAHRSRFVNRWKAQLLLNTLCEVQ